MSNSSLILDTFWKLIDLKDAVRIDAASRILTTISKQAKENLSEEKENDDNRASSSLSYCVERLVKGLASTNETSIKGFFICLVELLRQHAASNEDASVDKVFSTISKVLHVKGCKSEEGEYMRGRMLSYGAVIRSGKASPDQLGFILEKLLSLSSKRSYLATPAYNFIIEALGQLSESDFISHALPRLTDSLKSKPLTFESLWLIVEMKVKFGGVFNKARILQTFGRKKYFDQDFVKNIADLLTDTSGSVGLKPLAKLPALSKLLIELEKESLLDLFWLKQLEPRATKSSIYKSSIAVIVFNAIVANIKDVTKIPKLFTDNLMSIYISILSLTKTAEVETVILATFDKLIGHATTNPELQSPILKWILTGSGNIAFDKVSGSTVVQRLIAIADTKTVKEVSEFYLEAMLGKDSSFETPPTSKERAFAAHQLAKLMIHPKTYAEKEWKVTTISYILMATMFEVKKPVLLMTSLPKPFSREAKVELKPVFFKALDVKSNSLDTLCDVLHGVAVFASKLLQKTKSAQPVTPLDAKTIKSWQEMFEVVEKIRSADTKRKEDIVFQLLFIHVGFQLFSDPDMAIDVLSDLHVCLEKSKLKKKSKRKSVNSSGDEEPEWIEVVVDLLLSLLSQNKHVLRQVVGTVMTVLSPHINDNALQAIIDVISPPKSDDEGGEETIDEDDDDDYVTESEEDVEEGEGAEEEEENDDDANAETDDSEDDDDEDDDESNVKIDDELRDKLKAALGEHVDSDQESIDMDDLEDEDMDKMNEALSNIFKTLCKKKSQGEKKKEMMDKLATMHFKIRTIDMLEIYLSHEPKLAHVLFLIQPAIAALEDAIKDPTYEPLVNRLVSILKKISNHKKLSLEGFTSVDVFINMIQALVDWANTASPVLPLLSQPIPVFAQCCSLVLKYGEKYEEQNNLKPEIIKMYNKALDEFFNKGHGHFSTSFFLVPINAGCRGVFEWSNTLSENAFSSDTRLYRRTQAVLLITALLRHPAAASDESDKYGIVKLAENIVDQLKDELVRCASIEEENKPRHIFELLNLCFALQKAGPSNIELLKEPLDALRDAIPKNRFFSDAKRTFNKVAIILGIKTVSQSEKKKPKAQTSGILKLDSPNAGDGAAARVNGSEKKKKKKKKKNMSNEAKKKKKERKMFEVEGQFKGQEMPSFAGIVMTDNMNFTCQNGVVSKEKVQKPKSAKRKLADAETSKKQSKKEKKI